MRLTGVVIAVALLGVALAQVKKDPDLNYRSTTLVGSHQCCGAKIMDSDRRVAIETNGELEPGVYSSVEVKFCETDPLHLQLYRMSSVGEYELRWQIRLHPNISHITQQSVIIDLEEDVEITKDDRIGLFNPEENGAKFSIPYDFSAEFSLYLSRTRREKDEALEISDHVIIDNLKWPRSFRPYITFCSEPNCPRRPAGDNIFIQGPPGPPGPPGAPGTGNLVGGLDDIYEEFEKIAASCSPTDDLERTINSQNQKLSDIDNQMTELNQIIRQLTESTAVSSICAPGFIPGAYGVTSCYLIYKDPVPFALAHLQCRENNGASLVSIESQLEDTFLKNEIIKLFSGASGVLEERFWMAGMYNVPRKSWVWFDESRRTKQGMTYTNWRTVYPPQPVNLKVDVCSTLNVAPITANSTWDMRACLESNYYICEIPKQCL